MPLGRVHPRRMGAFRPRHDGPVNSTPSPDAVTTGRYRYLLNGQEIDVDERFEIVVRDDGVVVSSARSAQGTRLSVQCVYSDDGVIGCVLEWTSELNGTAPSVLASYVVVADGSVEATWSVADGPEQSDSIPAGLVALSFFPLMRVFSGRSVAKLVAVAPQPVPVLVPDIRDPKAVDSFLTPLLGDRFAASVDDGVCEVDGVNHACVVVDYRGGSYDSDATVYLDDGGLLLRYTWPQEGVGEWDVRLSDVEGPWPTPSTW
jgi:hypothetical protein